MFTLTRARTSRVREVSARKQFTSVEQSAHREAYVLEGPVQDSEIANGSFRPIADISGMPNAIAVRCFRVLIHGQFERLVRLGPANVATRGFYTTRWVIADAEESAIRKAFHSATLELQRWPDIRDGLVGVDMEAEDVGAGSWWRWLRGGGKGFAFYVDE